MYCLHFSEVHVHCIVYIFLKSMFTTVLFTFFSSPCVLYCLHFSQVHVYCIVYISLKSMCTVLFTFFSSLCVLHCFYFSQVHLYCIVYIFLKSMCTALFTFLKSIFTKFPTKMDFTCAQLRALTRNSVIIAFVFSFFYSI